MEKIGEIKVMNVGVWEMVWLQKIGEINLIDISCILISLAYVKQDVSVN